MTPTESYAALLGLPVEGERYEPKRGSLPNRRGRADSDLATYGQVVDLLSFAESDGRSLPDRLARLPVAPIRAGQHHAIEQAMQGRE